MHVNTNDGMTHLALHVACVSGHLAVIREMLLHPRLDVSSVRAALTTAVGLKGGSSSGGSADGASSSENCVVLEYHSARREV